MKPFALLATILASVTTAITLPVEDLYYRKTANLVVTSDEPELNGRILTVSGGTVSFDNVTTASAQVFVAGSTMTAADPKDMLVQIYVLSEIDNNQVLALDGAPGLQALVQTSAITNTAGPVIDAQSFLANPADSTITDNHAGSWIAMPKPTGGWHVYWYDGQSIITQNYFPIQITATAA